MNLGLYKIWKLLYHRRLRTQNLKTDYEGLMSRIEDDRYIDLFWATVLLYTRMPYRLPWHLVTLGPQNKVTRQRWSLW